MSRQQAAERLVDLAYALTAGCPLELHIDGRLIKVSIADELRLGHELTSTEGRVELELTLTWSTPEA